MNYTSYITSIFLNCLSKDNHQVLYSQGSSPTQVARFCSTTSYRLLTCFNVSISQGIFRRCSITHLSFLEAKLFQSFLRVELLTLSIENLKRSNIHCRHIINIHSQKLLSLLYQTISTCLPILRATSA